VARHDSTGWWEMEVRGDVHQTLTENDPLMTLTGDVERPFVSGGETAKDVRAILARSAPGAG
jgi:hypothetical protein